MVDLLVWSFSIAVVAMVVWGLAKFTGLKTITHAEHIQHLTSVSTPLMRTLAEIRKWSPDLRQDRAERDA